MTEAAAGRGGRIRVYAWLGAAALALVAVSLLGPALLQLLPRNASFSVSADTELFVLATARPTTPRWWVDRARVRHDDGPADCAAAEPSADPGTAGCPFRGFVEVGHGAKVEFQRIADGPLTILIESAKPAPGADGTERAWAATLHAEDESVIASAHDWLQLTIDPGHDSFVAPLYGAGIVGSETYAPAYGQQPPLLTGGRVQVLDRALVGGRRFPVMDVTLELGDEVSVLSRRQDDAQSSAGGKHATSGDMQISDGAWIVQAGGRPDDAALRVIGHMIGDELRIRHFGVQPFELHPSVWAYVAAEPLLQVLLIAIGSALLVLFERLMEMTLTRPEPREIGPPAERAEGRQDARRTVEPPAPGPDHAAVLAQIPLFSSLTPEQNAALAAGAELKSLAEGDLLIDDRAALDAVYFVLDGRLEVCPPESEAGDEVASTAVSLGPGAVVGAEDVVGGLQARGRVRAAAPSRLLRLPADEVRRLLGPGPPPQE